MLESNTANRRGQYDENHWRNIYGYHDGEKFYGKHGRISVDRMTSIRHKRFASIALWKLSLYRSRSTPWSIDLCDEKSSCKRQIGTCVHASSWLVDRQNEERSQQLTIVGSCSRSVDCLNCRENHNVKNRVGLYWAASYHCRQLYYGFSQCTFCNKTFWQIAVKLFWRF